MPVRGSFIVARNPDASSSLPYLIGLPIEGGLWFKARDSWPRSSRVYCHPLPGRPPGRLAVIEQVPVRSCARRGAAIDLVLDRGVNRRSQFVFARQRGRSIVLWQTPLAALSARPGVRVPGRHLPVASLLVLVDSRERYPYRFASRGVSTERKALAAGDYAVSDQDVVVAAVERKTLGDFAKGLSDGSLAFVMSHLATLRSAAVVVEGNYSRLLRNEHVRAGWLGELAALVQIRHPSVPIVYAESRKIAEEWTCRFLAAALAEARDSRLPLDQVQRPRTARKRTPKLMTGTELLQHVQQQLRSGHK